MVKKLLGDFSFYAVKTIGACLLLRKPDLLKHTLFKNKGKENISEKMSFSHKSQ